MTKKYPILRKRLKELESQLANVLSLPPEVSTASRRRQQQLEYQFQDMEQKLAFLKSLLSAEMSSHDMNPKHLAHMCQRLAELETIIAHRDSLELTSSVLHHVDSTCSCAESLINDDGEVSADGFNGSQPEGGFEEEDYDKELLPVVVYHSCGDDGGDSYRGIVEEKERVMEAEGGGELVDGRRIRSMEQERESKRRSGSGGGGGGGVGMMCGAVATGWVLGMVSMGLVIMAGLSSLGFPFPCGLEQCGTFLAPT